MENTNITSANFSGPSTGFGMQSDGNFNMPKEAVRFIKAFGKLRKRPIPILKLQTPKKAVK